MNSQEGVPQQSEPLRGCRILLIFQNRLTYSVRLLENVRVLKRAGAQVSLITADKANLNNPLFNSVDCVRSWEFPIQVGASNHKIWILRVASNIFRGIFRRVFQYRINTFIGSDLQRRLSQVVQDYDIFWAIDADSLPSTMSAASGNDVRVVYETIDLVPEYRELPNLSRSRKRHERNLVQKVDGFVTAGEEYANYYVSAYGESGLKERPLVRENSHECVYSEPTAPHLPYEILFFGNIAPDRPIEILLRAFSEVRSDARLTIMGRNLVESLTFDLIDELGLGDKVKVESPCAPEDGVFTAHRFDIGIAMLSGDNENERRAPTAKICTYLAAGLAIIASDLPGMRLQIGSADALFVKDSTIKAWTEALNSITEMEPTQISEMKMSSLRRAKEIDLRPQLDKYLQLFVKIYNKNYDAKNRIS